MAQMKSLTMLGLSVNSLSGEFPPVLNNLTQSYSQGCPLTTLRVLSIAE